MEIDQNCYACATMRHSCDCDEGKDALLHKLQEETDEWEEVPQEDLWEDGEISMTLVRDKILQHVLQIGDWKLMRRKDESSS